MNHPIQSPSPEHARSIDRTIRSLGLGLLCLVSSAVWAAPVNGVFTYYQPDDSTLQVKVIGDEFFAEEKTLDGRHIIKDPITNFWCYARLSEDGQSLESTEIIARDNDPSWAPLRSEQRDQDHLEIPLEMRKRIHQENRERLGIDAKGRNILFRDYGEQRHSQNGEPTEKSSTRSLWWGPTVGTRQGLTLLIRFPDHPQDVTFTREQVERYCNQMSPHYTEFGNNGSVAEYFYDVSNGKLNYTNTVVDYYTAKHNRSYYTDESLYLGFRAQELIREALDALEAANFDFRSLDLDGNGTIDAVNAFYAGPTVNAWAKGIWPHMSNVSWTSAKTGKRTSAYQITNMGTSCLTLGTFCHENGHMLCGFPDVYDYDYDSAGGAGVYCLMNSGGHGTNPCPPNGYLRYQAGWGSAETITASTNASRTLTAETSDGRLANQFLIYVNPSNSKEYFLVENRYQHDRDANIPTGGIAVWHVDEQGNHNNQNWSHQSAHNNYEVALIQASNQRRFERNMGGGDSYDLFYAGSTLAPFSDTSDSGTYDNMAHWWNGAHSGLKLSSYSVRGNTMSLLVGEAPAITVTVSPASVTINAGSSQSFTTTVTGTTNPAVTWAVIPSTFGTITPYGVFTAVNTGTCKVRATSVADNSKFAEATVTITAPPPVVSISISPTSISVQKDATQQFTSTVSGTTNPAVTWAVIPSTFGTITPYGVFTAATVGTCKVRATSVADSTKYAEATLTITTPPPVVSLSISPTSVSFQSGATQQFTSTVTGTTNPAVTWTVIPSTFGTITSSGVFTAVSVGTCTVRATSVADSTKYAQATVTVTKNDGDSVTTFNEGESNNNVVSANAVPDTATTIVGTIDSKTDLDFFTVNVAAGATLTVNMTGPALDYDLYLYDRSETMLMGSLNPNTATERVTWTNTGTSTVTTTLLVLGYANAYSTTTPYNLTLDRGTVDPPGPVKVTIHSVTENLEAGVTKEFKASVTGSANTAVTWTVTSETIGTVTPSGVFTAVNAGTCTVRATSVADNTQSAEATVTVTKNNGGGVTTFNEVESNNNVASANAVPDTASTIVGTIDSKTDLDFFTVNVAAGATLTVNMTGPALDYDLYLYDSSGTMLMGSLNPNTATERVTWTNTGTSAVTTTLLVLGYANAYSTTTPYTLTLSR